MDTSEKREFAEGCQANTARTLNGEMIGAWRPDVFLGSAPVLYCNIPKLVRARKVY